MLRDAHFRALLSMRTGEQSGFAGQGFVGRDYFSSAILLRSGAKLKPPLLLVAGNQDTSQRGPSYIFGKAPKPAEPLRDGQFRPSGHAEGRTGRGAEVAGRTWCTLVPPGTDAGVTPPPPKKGV